MNSKSTTVPAKRVFLLLLGLMALLSPFGFVVWAVMDSNPKVNIPTPVLPNPNAFDDYVKAGNAIVNLKDIQAATERRPLASHKVYTQSEKSTLLLQNMTALQMFRQGFKHEYRQPPIRSMATTQPYFAKFRSLTRLLALESQVRAAEGEWNRAINSDLDILRLGEDLPRGSGILGRMVGYACQDMALRDAGRPLEHLDAAQSRAAARRLEGILARQVAFADLLQEEKWQGQAAMLELFRDPKWRDGLVRGDDTVSSVDRFKDNTKLAMLNKKQALRDYARYMDDCIAVARQPYGLHTPYPTPPEDPVNNLLAPMVKETQQTDIKGKTQTAQLLLAFALRAYRLEHQRYPATLQELVPSYLSRLPLDPMSGQAPFGYQRAGDSYSLSSAPPASPPNPASSP